ncbi:MAG TPA: acyl-CoA synthetase [Acidimicrobiales bacterium]|nr:acyl-CoA synthetase [Acidimicrobiales bacterium]
MAYNIADLFEHAVDVVPDRTGIIVDGEARSYAQLEAAANQVAANLAAAGIGPGDHVGIYGPNSPEWMETMLGSFKVRAVPINVNYRYVTEELTYLFDNADLVALVFDAEFAERVEEVRSACPKLRHLIHIGPANEHTDALGSIDYHSALAAESPERVERDRSPDDLYVLYTGGTTGFPKGVMWRQEDVFYALGGGIDALTNEPVETEFDLARKAASSAAGIVSFALAPLMHGAAQWNVLRFLFEGGTTVMQRRFDPTATWYAMAEHGVNTIMITGDAMGRPIIEAYEEIEDDLDLTSWFGLASSAAVFSPTVKDRFLEHFPNLMIIDAIGSTETGSNGMITMGKGETAMKGGGPTVTPGKDATVVDDDLEPVPAGSGIIGRLARTGNVPLGYYKDPEKSAEVFVIAPDGTRMVLAGDNALREADGSITLLGRGSQCINSGGEKIFPEEVEQALKAHPDVFDAIVVGVPDERWGQRVAAVVQPRVGRTPTLADLDPHCRLHVAGYKVPREVHLVDQVVRAPSGKPDYPWAKRVAAGDLSVRAADLRPDP